MKAAHLILLVNFGLFVLEQVDCKKDPPRIVFSPYPNSNFITLREYHKLQLECKANGIDPLRYQWLKDGKSIKIDDRITTHLWRLNISVLLYSDRGEYTCIVSNRYGQVNQTYTLEIMKPPYFVNRNSHSYMVSIIHFDEPTILDCTAAGPEPITYRWLKDGKDFPSRKFQAKTPTLKLQNYTMDTTGTYTCIASNTYGSTSRDIPFKVYGPAAKLRFVQNMPQVVHRKLEKIVPFDHLPCNFEGPLNSTITWYFNGKPLNKSPDVNVYSESLYREDYITIKKNTKDYAGNYTCVISHLRTSLSRTFIVAFTKQGIPKIQYFSYYPMASFRSNPIEATVSGEKPLTYQWQKDGKPIQRPYQPRLQTNQPSLDLKYISQSDSGNYTFTVTNRDGGDSFTEKVDVSDVSFGVHFAYIDGPDNAIAAPSSNVTLQCVVASTYQGMFQWFYKPINGKTALILDQRDVRGLTQTDSVVGNFFISELHIKDVCEFNYGFYSCSWIQTFALSRHGGNEYVTLEKWPLNRAGGNKEPRFPFELKTSVLALPGIEKVLKCPAYGKGPLTFTWSKGKHKLPSNTNEFVLKNPDPCHNGEYKCEVSNKYGTISHVFTLRVPENVRSKPVLEVTNTTVQLGNNATMTCASKVFETQQFFLNWIKLASNLKELDADIPGNIFISNEIEVYPELRPNKKYEIKYLVENFQPRNQLKIINTTKSDLGLYACCGDNVLGMTCTYAYLNEA